MARNFPEAPYFAQKCSRDCWIGVSCWCSARRSAKSSLGTWVRHRIDLHRGNIGHGKNPNTLPNLWLVE